MSTWTVDEHDGIDKGFYIRGPLDLYVDYDDVHHEAVDILADEVVRILRAHFETPNMYICSEPDEDLEIPRPGSKYSWDTLMCHNTALRERGPCPVCGGPTRPVRAES